MPPKEQSTTSLLEDGQRALDDAAHAAIAIRIDLDERYLRAIARVEALPANQTGMDKGWVWRVLDGSARHFARAKPKRWTSTHS